MVLASASAFMKPTISTSPVAASVATHVIRPSASNFGASSVPSSTCSTLTRRAKDVTALSSAALPHQHDEARLLGRVVPEGARELHGHGRGAGLLHAAQAHALVLGLDHHGDAAGFQDLVHGREDLGRQLLLGLQAARI